MRDSRNGDGDEKADEAIEGGCFRQAESAGGISRPTDSLSSPVEKLIRRPSILTSPSAALHLRQFAPLDIAMR